jgi:hypothetical protein
LLHDDVGHFRSGLLGDIQPLLSAAIFRLRLAAANFILLLASGLGPELA